MIDCHSSVLTLDATGSTCIGNPGRSIGISRASDARTSLINERESKALGATRALSNRKLAPDALGEPAVDACLLAIAARRVGAESRKFGVESLRIFAILEGEGLRVGRGSRRRCRWWRSGFVVCGLVVRVGRWRWRVTSTSDPTGGTGGSDACLGVGVGRAGDAGSGLVHQRQREALGTARTLRNCEFATHTVGKATADACLITSLARRVCVEGAELGVQRLCVFAVLECKRLSTCWGSWCG